MPIIAWGVELENLTEASRVVRLRPHSFGYGSIFALYSEEWFLLNAYSEEGKEAPFLLLLTLPFYSLVIFDQKLAMAELDYRRRRMREYMTGVELGQLEISAISNLQTAQSTWWSGLAIEFEKLGEELLIGSRIDIMDYQYMILFKLLSPFLL